MSCQKQLTSNDYIKWVSDPDNGLRKDQNANGFELSLMYQPQDYNIARDLEAGIEITDYQTKVETLGKSDNFQFRIKLTQGGNILRYKQDNAINENTRINHYSFLAKGDFTIITDTDTASCQLCHYSRNYNLTPTVDLSILFDELNKKSDWQIIYKDTQFGLGTVKFVIKESDINNIPSLKV